MRVTSETLRTKVTPSRAFSVLAHHNAARGLPPPAMLSGEWFGAQAVIAPSLAVAPGALPPVSPVPAPPGVIGGGWFGYLSYDAADPPGGSGARRASGWGGADHVRGWSPGGTCHLKSLDGGAPSAPKRESLLPSPPADLSWTAGPLRR